MRKNFWQIVNQVIRSADILLLVLDARQIDKTRNEEVEKKIRRSRKPIVYVISKADLANKEDLEKISLKPSVFVSAKERHGTTILRDRILIEAKTKVWRA